MSKKKQGIVDYFPNGYTPRPGQVDCLKEIESSWNDYDVFVVNLPVASGKSYIAKTIQNWQKNGAIITPNNLLVEQYRADFPTLAGIIGKARYDCKQEGMTSCKRRGELYGKRVGGRLYPKQCKDCPWSKDNRKIRSHYVKKYITNNHLYAQMQKFQSVLIADEAHNLIDFLQDWHSVRIPHAKYRYPRHGGRIDRDHIKSWINSLTGLDKIITNPDHGQKGLQVLHAELNGSYPRFLLKEEAVLRSDVQGNEWHDIYLKLCPVDIRDMIPVLWPRQVQKIVLMSATINEKDIEELGLQDKRIKYIQSDSCIPADRRPVTFLETSTISGSKLSDTIDLVTERVLGLAAEHRNSKGLVHATYNQAALLKYLLKDKRFLFHDRKNKKQVYEQFRETSEPIILVASGLYEGIDLPQDAGRWQVISKVPFPSLGEPAIKYRMAKDKDWYSWAAIKTMLQASGRICRGPDDFGETYIIDNNFKRLYSDNLKFFPGWYQDSVRGI